MLVLSRADVEALLDPLELVEAVGQAMAQLSAGRASMPPRGAAMVADREAMLAAMPAYLPASGALTTKLVSLFPQNQDRPTHQALIVCFDPENGTPMALMDGTYITAARTAAGAVLATRLLARSDAKNVAIVGTGVQAFAQARAFSHTGRYRIQIAGRDPDKVAALVNELAACDIEVSAAPPSIEAAVSMSDTVCLATHAFEPVIDRRWLRAGTHINSVGYNTAGTGEVDFATIRDALVVVESRAAALAPPPAGAVELRLAIEHGATSAEQAIELGAIIAGLENGRTDDQQITLYKSVGVAVQDAAAAALVLEAALKRGLGQQVAL